MAATFTSSDYFKTPVLPPDGNLRAQTFAFSYGGRSASVSDVIYIGRIALGARIVGGYVKGKPGSDAACTWKVGIGPVGNAAANDVYFGPALSISTSICTRLEAATGFPKVPSISADQEGLLYIPVIVTKSTGTSTATGSIQLTLLIQGE